MSQSFSNIVGDSDSNVIVFTISANTLGISNGSAIQLSGTDDVTGTTVTNFTNQVDDGTTYYVGGFSGSGPFQFHLSTNSSGNPPIAAGSGNTFTINNPEVVSFSLTGGVCFLGNSLVHTDQGKIAIKDIELSNTINGHEIKKVTNMINERNYVILFKKDSLGENVPDRNTYVTRGHGIYINGELRPAVKLVNGDTIVRKKMVKSRIYNVLLDHHGKMKVNNMLAETLHPDNKYAK